MRRESVVPYLDDANDIAHDILPFGRIHGEAFAVASSDLLKDKLTALTDGLETRKIALRILRGTRRGR
jgi:hypothetical protein